MRSESIRQFEYFYWASIVLGVMNLGVAYAQASFTLPYLLGYDFRFALGFVMTGAPLASQLAVGLLFVLVVPLALWFLAARRANKPARWVASARGLAGLARLLVLVWLLGWLVVTRMPVEGWVWYAMLLGVVGETLHVAAVSFLFLGDAADWFERGPAVPRHQDIFS